ncbi:hypothetical protein GRI43_04320 [Altererythrobacter luteolus]|uniref:SPOR domain-containing protein n=1 Tax=Pontixanthobacter luteolus TaxID=295089 RepID=A0A6I4V061_9SPHN|nr:SPOR domain-containing protein [Pontixanthobacter luteolus]MXP46621.1 hypothetical protein [Pontixanthobacter luteolus]
MRLPTDVRYRFLALGLTATLAACGRGGNDFAAMTSTGDTPAVLAQSGPAADYPVVLGEPYSIDGTLYTPVDTLNHDEVGYASLDSDAGNAVSIAHKTLPLPSYVEVTSLDTGKTILARAERRGPMSNDYLVALSAGAATQLGVAQGAPVRVRRVNPPEAERAKLRSGETAPDRMDTPKSLLTALVRNLPAKGFTSLSAPKTGPALASNNLGKSAIPPSADLPAMREAAPAAADAPTVDAAAPAAKETFADAFRGDRKAVGAYPLPPIASSAASGAAELSPPVQQGATKAEAPATVQVATPQQPSASQSATDGFVIQAAAFSSKANADRAASSIDGFVQKSGKYFRVRKGPFANRGQAEAALAKVRDAGYRDARVYTTG